MEYKVVTARRAKADLVSIADYITHELYAPQAALDLLDEIGQQSDSLKQMPKRHALVLDERLARLGIRTVPVKNYLIFYVVDDKNATVVVVRIMYAKRDWAHLL